ncbi:MAG: YdcF family protein [Marinoscillum sp.]
MTILAFGILKGGGKRIWIIIGFVLLVIFTNPLLCNLALRNWEAKPIMKDQLPLVETAIVLGGMVELDKEPKDQLHLNGNIDRIEETITLLKDGLIQQMVISGGSGSLLHDTPESVELMEFVLKRGVKPRQVIIEPQSRNTYENAVESAKILDSLNLKEQPLLLVTSAFHMPRALLCFKKQGINVIAYPVDYKSSNFTWSLEQLLPSADALATWQLLIREWVGILAYKVTGYT